ncbi:hypothetical protein BJX61DRAFT_495511 [Aspergillus egyptiacus]|nr:hypothetical protein BJX61DRAFT_495511 [Aspergillus egyptiacus]
MPKQPSHVKDRKSRSIRRVHSGCQPCRRRGKKCDETKPCCRACMRLALQCSYGVNLGFRNLSPSSFEPQTAGRGQVVPVSRLVKSRTSCAWNSGEPASPKTETQILQVLPPAIDSGDNLVAGYWGHFQRHVCRLIPATPAQLTQESLKSPCLRYAVLCIAASNLSMLNAPVQSRTLANDSRRSVFSPLVNTVHHAHARKYHDRAVWHCRNAAAQEIELESPQILAAYILLAYYHHASTHHRNFRLAVWDTVRFVLRHRDHLANSPAGREVLQMWYRLCVSHRLSKPPALLLEGEGDSSFQPNRFPDSFDRISLTCIMGMSTDDLIYDILIKTLEIRSRMVLFRCVANRYNISESANDIGTVAHGVLNDLLGREEPPDEQAEAKDGFVQGEHLLGLLDVQRERLAVWKSRLHGHQMPDRFFFGDSLALPAQNAPDHRALKLSQHSEPPLASHRDAMNALYYLLCTMIFKEAHLTSSLSPSPSATATATEQTPTMDTLATTMLQIVNNLDFNSSNSSDVYTFSLAETLLQLVLTWRSTPIFDSILDVVWPRLESKARGYEHSHYPTHLVKRIIAQLAGYWAGCRAVKFVLPAVAEDMPKVRLLDVGQPVEIVVCGCDAGGRWFMERVPLP